jgi:hypothetical protein
MALSGPRARMLVSMTLALGLAMSSVFTSTAAAEVRAAALDDFSAEAPREASWSSRLVAGGVGALTGAILYSVATRDWGWAWGLWGMAATAARRIVGAGAPVTAAGVVRAGASRATIWSSIRWAGRVVVVTLSALAGAYLGDSIYVGFTR